MIVTMVVFVFLFLFLLLINRKAKKVGPFNIVFAAERPDRPETTHYAHNFFAPYNRALGFLTKPAVTGFYKAIGEWTSSIANALRYLYTGNGQTYALHIVLFVGIVFMIARWVIGI